MKQSINTLFQKIARISGIPPIFIDPIIWKISGDKCIDNFCYDCFLRDTLGYDCLKSTKIHRVSKNSGGTKGYRLFWSRRAKWQLDLPKGYKSELRGRRN